MSGLLIIGGSDAGVSAALRARELSPETPVRLVLADAYPNFSICGLPFLFSGQVGDWRALAHRTLDELEATGMQVLPNSRALRVDPDEHAVEVTSAAGTSWLRYDRLVIATGASPVRPAITGVEQSGVHFLHDVSHARALLADIERVGARHVVIIGGGYIGLEMADALRHAGHDVTLLERGPQPMGSMDPSLGALLGARMRAAGVHLDTGVDVRGIARRGAELVVDAGGGREVAAPLVLVVVGVTPNAALGVSAGVRQGVRGALCVDDAMGTNVADVLAAGDCVETWHRLLARPTWLPLGSTAHKQGRVAGENAVGGEARYAGSLGTQVVKVFGAVLGRTGLGHEEAEREGHDPMTVELEAWDHKAYYPGATRLHLRLTARRADGLLLGAQLMGDDRAEVSKRLDVVALALHQRLTVGALSDVDLSYTPPLSSPWDPVQLVAQRWEEARRA